MFVLVLRRVIHLTHEVQHRRYEQTIRDLFRVNEFPNLDRIKHAHQHMSATNKDVSECGS